MLAARPRSGYEIKQLVDNSARFFWAASYGQIYPELNKLEDAGLISGTDASQGARQRTVFKLTAKGRRAAEEWIKREAAGIRTPGRGLLELFFAGSIEPSRTARSLASGPRPPPPPRRSFARSTGIEQKHQAEGAGVQPRTPVRSTVLRYGIEMNEWVAKWFERAAQNLDKQTAAVGAARG